MNKIFESFLCHFILVFIYDNMIYSKHWQAHVIHVDKVLQLLVDHKISLKWSNCVFGVSEVECVGHIVGHHGLCVDPNKIEVMKDWSFPKNLKCLRIFLVITSYYRMVIKNYGNIANPFTTLFKINSFSWNDATKWVFKNLNNFVYHPSNQSSSLH
jgi:hypothetical protein